MHMHAAHAARSCILYIVVFEAIPAGLTDSGKTLGHFKSFMVTQYQYLSVAKTKNISQQNNKRANEGAFILLQQVVISVVRALMLPFAWVLYSPAALRFLTC
jgi:hypothetical protein